MRYPPCSSEKLYATLEHLDGVRYFSGMQTLLAVVMALVSQIPAQAAEYPETGWFTGLITQAISSAGRRAQTSFAIAVVDRHTGQTLWSEGFREHENVYPASMVKTLVAVSVLQRVDRGEIQLTDSVTIDQVNADAECGRGCARYGNGATQTIAQLMSAMIIHSNNIATNQLIDVATKEGIARTARELGAEAIEVLRKVYVRVNPEPHIETRNRGTAAAFIELYREIVSGHRGLLSEASRSHLQDLLARCHSRTRFNARFPQNITFFHKTGSTSQSSGDAGYYFLDEDRAVIIAGLQDFRIFMTLQQMGAAILARLHP